MELNKIYNVDCVGEGGMCLIPDKSIDMILCDLPYGTTVCEWDTIIPFDVLWGQYKRVIKDNGAIVLFGAQPFTSKLIVSNLDMFKYSLVWEKTRINGFAQAPYKFMNKTEDIAIFSNGGCAKNANPRMTFNPQGLIYDPKVATGQKAGTTDHRRAKTDQKPYISAYTNYPNNLLRFDSEWETVHPTQKPVVLFEYLIKTYTHKGDTVLDNCIGSGTTAVACLSQKRNFIGFETNEKYFRLATERIKQYAQQKRLF